MTAHPHGEHTGYDVLSTHGDAPLYSAPSLGHGEGAHAMAGRAGSFAPKSLRPETKKETRRNE